MFSLREFYKTHAGPVGVLRVPPDVSFLTIRGFATHCNTLIFCRGDRAISISSFVTGQSSRWRGRDERWPLNEVRRRIEQWLRIWQEQQSRRESTSEVSIVGGKRVEMLNAKKLDAAATSPKRMSMIEKTAPTMSPNGRAMDY